MMLDLLFELLLEKIVLLPGKIVLLLGKVGRGIRRALNVRRSGPSQSHTVTEYVDALLFSDEPPETSDPSRPLSIVETPNRNTPTPNA
jgi:hypothetical protein